jgi:hypothetical protein
LGVKVLICGGRNFHDWGLFSLTMVEWSNKVGPFTHYISGGAPGADTLARRWAKSYGAPLTEYRANWHAHGRAAGPIRNQKMLDEGKPDLVIAFPGGPGTADMVRRAKTVGVRVVEVA